ncbi:Mitogen-activated protein kinase 15 [Cichlidogyrus casuarinus]|uniref:Mitogen-activated protein kinase 15 n=1 Tax=Cichlidogyrus casuarinus TaxID=1844966 RepID=A0ABD2QFP5_9PLAT
MDWEIEEHIYKRYQIHKRLGKGAYGIVWKATNIKTNITVALKKIFDAFRNEVDAQRTYREIAFLQEFSGHPNIIRLLNVIRAENDKDIYLVFQYMDIHRKYIIYQILKAIKYIHSANVIHRDLKPSNILLDSSCNVRICDFGLTRSLNFVGSPSSDDCDPTLTEYVATRWYRAPEILLASNTYTTGVDIWSIGCIFGEMFLGKPLFPGSSTINQIEKIIASVPRPSRTGNQDNNWPVFCMESSSYATID